MPKLPWKPWHEVVRLREDLRSGELPLHMFAADLYEVLMQSGKRPVYEDPEEFFALTFPTYNLRQLVRDVVLRLAGKNDKAVRQLELTYGGGKTHTLITLLHLVTDPPSAAGPARRGRVRRSHRPDAAQGARGRALLRQAGRRERHGGALAGRQGPHAQAALERAGLPARRRRGAEAPARRQQGRGTRQRPGREPLDDLLDCPPRTAWAS